MCLQRKYSIEDIEAEIAKCRTLCRNCHAIRTSEQQGHFWEK